MESLLQGVSTWRPFRVLVVGDYMLDQHFSGDADRLAGDAPVPILHVKQRSHAPGGAANLCLDLSALRGEVLAFGVTGSDDAARLLRDSLTASGVRCGALIVDGSRPTTVKQNLIGMAQGRHPQKMFRVDFESREPLSRATEDALLEAFGRELAAADVVCIEDYAKGVCTPRVCQGVIEAARRAGKPVFVDPAKLDDYSKYAGATAITPNRTEAEFAAGMVPRGDPEPGHNEAVARTLRDRHGFQAVILTLDKQGALLLGGEDLAGGDGGRSGGGLDQAVTIPTVAREVYDVTGAGDMFLAGLAAARANGMSWLDAVHFANAGAGLEVEVFGVQPIPLERIHQFLLDQHLKTAGVAGKVRTWEQAAVEVSSQKRAGRSVVFTNGCFDVLHAGHVTMLERAREQGDLLVVGLNDDSSVRRLKGPSRPVNGQDDRARVLSSLGCVDLVVLFGSGEGEHDTPLQLIRKIRPDVLIKGADYAKESVVGASDVESWGGRVVLIDLVPGRSTTGTIARMRSGR